MKIQVYPEFLKALAFLCERTLLRVLIPVVPQRKEAGVNASECWGRKCCIPHPALPTGPQCTLCTMAPGMAVSDLFLCESASPSVAPLASTPGSCALVSGPPASSVPPSSLVIYLSASSWRTDALGRTDACVFPIRF
jgi:hypothetical protein